MKKLISILLIVIMLASVVHLGIYADEGESAVLPLPDLAADSIGTALNMDVANGTLTGLAATDWSFQHGETFDDLVDYTINKTGPFGTYVYGAGGRDRFPTNGPTGYTFNTVSVSYHIQNVAVYNSNHSLVGNTSNSPSDSGVIFSVSQRKEYDSDNWFSMTYTAPRSGKLSLSDPDGGNIASIWNIGHDASGEIKTNCVYGTGNQRNVNFAIYKNDEKIWPADGVFKFYHNTNSDRVFYTAFPTLDDISVEKGDKLRLVFDGSTNTTDCSMCFTLNPQITYSEVVEDEVVMPKADIAYATLKKALSLDAAATAPEAIHNTNWSFSRGKSIEELDSGFTVKTVGNFGFYRNGITESAKLTNAYIFNSVKSWYRDNITVYERENSDISSAVRTGFDRPVTGIVFALTQIRDLEEDNAFSINYTAPYSGKITLSDPQNGFVANIGSIGGGSTANADDTARVKKINFAIYKNNEKIWPQDSDGALFVRDTYYHAFPTIEELEVTAGDTVKIAFINADPDDSQSYAASFALNPQVVYTELSEEEEEEDNDVIVYSDTAYTTVGNALTADVAGGSAKEYFKMDWTFMHGETFETLEEYTIEKLGPFGTYRFSARGEAGYERLVPAVTPNGYIFNKVIYDVYDENVAVYDAATYPDITPNKAGTLPSKGVMFSVSQHVDRPEDDWFSMTYTAPHGGTINIGDLDGGRISSIANFGMTADNIVSQTLCVNDGDKKQVKLAIYKNDQKIWPQDSDGYVFNADNYSVKFPKIKGINVDPGDKIHITFNGSSTSGSFSMAFALNPTVSYTYVEPFKLEDQDILDMINNTTVSNSAAVFESAIDADAASGQTNYLSADAPWSIQKSTVGYQYGWSELSANYVKNFFVLDLRSSGWPQITGSNYPFGYQYDNVWEGHDWAVYDTANTDEVTLTGRGNMPAKGMLGYFNKPDAYYALCYKAPKSGTYRIYDPDGSDITAISHIDGIDMLSLDNDQKRLHIAIYKNDQKIWPQDADYYELNKQKGSVEFPDIQGIQMNSDDVLRIVFKNDSRNNNGPMRSGMVVALNPQVDFVNYFKSTNDATEQIDKAIKTDIENGRDGFAGDTQASILYTDYSWKIETYKNGAWNVLNPMAVDDLQITAADGVKVPKVLPFGAVQLGAYDATHNVLADALIAESGVLLAVDDISNPVSLSYAITDQKYIRLRDILKGNIAMIKEICGVAVETPDDIKCTIYHNDTVLWPDDDILLSGGSLVFPDISVATEEDDKIRIVFESENPSTAKPLMVVMNPHLTGYSIAANKVITTEIGAVESHNAYSEINTALGADLTAQKPEAIYKTPWKVESSTDFGTAATPTWTVDELGYEDPANGIPMTYMQQFTVYNAASAPTANWPMAYAYNYNKFLATYNQDNNIKAFNVSRLPQNGVLMTTMNRKVWHSLTWTADKDGEIHVYDPNNGYITAIKSIDSVELRAHDFDANYSKDVEIAIYKNNEKLWPIDSDWFVAKSAGANEEKSVYFPDCVGVEVSKGDNIRIIIHSAGDSDTIPAVIAMNPQIDYTAVDYIRLNKTYPEKAPTVPPVSAPSTDNSYGKNDTVIDANDGTVTDEEPDNSGTPEEQQVIRRKKKVIRVVDNNMGIWLYVIIGGAVLLAAGAGVTVFILIKRRKANNGG